ncbi:MAG: hypothetical protein GX663_04135 [Clostridiales bacterium]|nr:hypothetical protein [Clostridiales bacterium]
MVADSVYSKSVTLKVLDTHEPVTIMQTVKNGNEALTTGTPIFEDDEKTISTVIVNSRDIADPDDLKRKLSARERAVELLQIEKGAFTGAERAGKIGLLEIANNDEITWINLRTTLLRFTIKTACSTAHMLRKTKPCPKNVLFIKSSGHPVFSMLPPYASCDSITSSLPCRTLTKASSFTNSLLTPKG